MRFEQSGILNGQQITLLFGLFLLVLISSGCAYQPREVSKNNECINTSYKTKNSFLPTLAGAMSSTAEAAYVLGFSDLLVYKELEDSFYSIYEYDLYYRLSCRPLPDSYAKDRFKDFAESAMLSGYKRMKDDTVIVRTTESDARKIIKMDGFRRIQIHDEMTTKSYEYMRKNKKP